jgi:hypothetical protein
MVIDAPIDAPHVGYYLSWEEHQHPIGMKILPVAISDLHKQSAEE